MAIIYTFDPTELDIAPSLDGLTDVVTRVRYNYTGVEQDSGVSSLFVGATPVPAPSAGFTPFEDLTEDEVISWLEIFADTTHMQQQIEKQINLILHPMYVPTTPPWAPSGNTEA
jgi:hypothetical protein